MRPIEALGKLRDLGLQVVETREAAALLGISTSNASQTLRNLADAGLVLKLRPGLWAINTAVQPFVAPPYLTAPYPAYVSLWSALAHHGMIEQLPRKIYVVSLDRRREIATPIGSYSIHHIAPALFDGYEGSGDTGFIATPEKALFDAAYIGSIRGRAYFPELELPEAFRPEKLERWVDRIASRRLRTLVSRGLRDAQRAAISH